MLQQYQQSNGANPALFPAGVQEMDAVKNRRVFRYQLQQQAQNTFDKKVLKYWSMKELEELSDKVRQPRKTVFGYDIVQRLLTETLLLKNNNYFLIINILSFTYKIS